MTVNVLDRLALEKGYRHFLLLVAEKHGISSQERFLAETHDNFFLQRAYYGLLKESKIAWSPSGRMYITADGQMILVQLGAIVREVFPELQTGLEVFACYEILRMVESASDIYGTYLSIRNFQASIDPVISVYAPVSVDWDWIVHQMIEKSILWERSHGLEILWDGNVFFGRMSVLLIWPE
jgi:hypothetical protein